MTEVVPVSPECRDAFQSFTHEYPVAASVVHSRKYLLADLLSKKSVWEKYINRRLFTGRHM